MTNILIIGATSAIAISCARLWAEKNANFFLIARHPEKLQSVANDLTARGAQSVHTAVLDVNQFDQHEKVLNNVYSTFNSIDIVLIAHGTLSNEKACALDVHLTLQELSTNGLSIISLLTLLAPYMEKQKKGTLAVISSVAGDRGRASVCVYASAKAAVSTFCEGLRNRLFKSGVHVLTIKPGFIDTPMTQNLSLPKMLVATPEKAAKDIVAAIDHKRNVLYTPSFWMLIMLVIRCIPSFVLKRLTF